MYGLFLSNRCKKSLKKLEHHKKFKKEIFDKVVGILLTGERLPKEYKEHKLSGDYVGCYECHIQNDILLIYYFDDGKCILYGIDIGHIASFFRKKAAS